MKSNKRALLSNKSQMTSKFTLITFFLQNNKKTKQNKTKQNKKSS